MLHCFASVIFIGELLTCAFAITGNRWFNYRLLINPGLTELFYAASAQDCFNQCSATVGCSAVSYQQGQSLCVKSMCANLHMVFNDGWNTFVLNLVMVESRDFPVPQLEWMLTDTCGLLSTGIIPAMPKMTFSGIFSYSSSPSVTLGRPVSLYGVYGVTEQSTQLNELDVTKGFTYFGWYNVMYENPFSFFMFDLVDNFTSIAYGNEFWYDYELLLSIYVADFTNTLTHRSSFVLPTNTWLHAALVYDPAKPGLFVYINGTLEIAVNMNGQISSHSTWNAATVGGRPGYGEFYGSLYCIKVFMSTLSADDIAATAKSCQVGRLRET